MTNEKLLDLLREARVFVGFCPTTQEGIDRVCEVRDCIDAALAAHRDEVPAQDSAKDVVEWRPSDQRVFLDGVSLRVVHHTDGLWVWSVYWPLSHRTEQGRVATEAEAKSAAIAAARGL
jgi:hypothetical protein